MHGFDVIIRWVLFGDLKDPYHEFFISKREDPSDDSKINVWLDTYQLRQSMLPSFLSLHLATKILVIGKSINFIRLCRARKPLASIADVPGAVASKFKDNESPRNSTKLLRVGSQNQQGLSRLASLRAMDAAQHASSAASDAGSIVSDFPQGGQGFGGSLVPVRGGMAAGGVGNKDTSPSRRGLSSRVAAPAPIHTFSSYSITSRDSTPSKGIPMKLGSRINVMGMPKPSVADALGYNVSPRFGDGHGHGGHNSSMHWFDSTGNDDNYSHASGLEDEAAEANYENSNNADIFFTISDEVESKLHDLKFGDEEKLTDIVTSISDVVDKKLLRMMFRDFHIVDHLFACKQFLLLGQGDFVTCLMDSIAPELVKPATKIYRHNLNGILEGALRSSNAQFVPSHILNRVLVRLLEPTNKTDSGWEIFALDYAVDMPINAVIHSDSISKYRLAFNMLWRLKRVEWSLSSSWKQLMSLSHTAWRGYGRDGRSAWRGEFPNLMPVLHRCTISRGRMVYVINNLCGFLMFEVRVLFWSQVHGTENLSVCVLVCVCVFAGVGISLEHTVGRTAQLPQSG
jgi:hypothetical protein